MTRARRSVTRGPRRSQLRPRCEPLEGRVVPSTIRVTSLLNAGRGTLRAAIQRADLNPGPDTIKFAPTALGTISLTRPLPALSTPIVISGWGPSYETVARSTAPGTPDFRIFTVTKGAVVKINGLSLAGGVAREGGGIANAGTLSLRLVNIAHDVASGSSPYGKAKGAGDGGGIANSGKLTIIDSVIGSNSATGLGAHYGYDGGGGGIANSGKLTILSSALIGNTVTGGSAFTGGDGDGGGIENSGQSTVTYTFFLGNSATGGAGYTGGSGGGLGGGIENSGSLTVTGSTFSKNSASSENQGIGGYGGGGGIANSGTLSVTGSLFDSNSAMGQYGSSTPLVGGLGGGITNAGKLTVATSTFKNNTARGSGSGGTAYGGGIANSGTLSVATSTFSDNSAAGGTGHAGSIDDGDGGGIENSGTLSLTNSTLGGNSASSLGGGMSSTGPASLTFVTAAGNSAPSGGGIAVMAGSNSLVKSIDTIYQNPQGGNLLITIPGTFASQGHNLFSDDPGVALAPTDLVNTDPLLGPLADNGGTTLTQALLPASPAIDAGIPVAGITTDQRGAARPTSGPSDIGAVQV